MGGWPRRAEVRRAWVSHVSRPWMPAHVGRVCEDRVRVVGGGVVLRQAMMGLMRWRLMQRRRTTVLERGSMVMPIIRVRCLALLGRMRLLW